MLRLNARQYHGAQNAKARQYHWGVLTKMAVSDLDLSQQPNLKGEHQLGCFAISPDQIWH